MIRTVLALLLVLSAAAGCAEVKPDEAPGGYGTPNRGRGA
jgi:hypothetical protein